MLFCWPWQFILGACFIVKISMVLSIVIIYLNYNINKLVTFHAAKFLCYYWSDRFLYCQVIFMWGFQTCSLLYVITVESMKQKLTGKYHVTSIVISLYVVQLLNHFSTMYCCIYFDGNCRDRKCFKFIPTCSRCP